MSAIVPAANGKLDVERARDMLARCARVDEAKDIRDKAKAIQVYGRERGAGAGAAADAAEIVARAEIRIGELLIETPKAKGGLAAGKSRNTTGADRAPVVTPSLPALLGMPASKRDEAKKLSARAQRLASMPKAAREEHIAGVRERAEATALGQRKTANFSSESVEWYTPARYIEAARIALGGQIDLDPASCAKANEVVQARRFFTAKDGGLDRPWKGTVWINPPYGDTDDGKSAAGVWGAKLIEEHRARRTTAGVLLVNAVTDRNWFQQFWDFPICFTDHRIEFYTPTGQPKQPVSGNAFVYCGRAVERFAKAFAEIGVTVARVR